MTDKEAMKLALEALESAEPKYTKQRADKKTLGGSLDYWKLSQDQRLKAITAIKEVLAQPQRTWVGLTDEEQQQAYEQWQNDGWGVFYNAIEAKLKQKNGYAEEKNT